MNSTRVYAGQDVAARRRERRERFLQAGLEQFGTAGYAATGVPSVCRAAGLSSRQFYQEFDSREDLLRALYDDLQDRAMTAVGEAVAGALESGITDLEAVVERGVRAFIGVFAADDRLVRLAFVEVVGVSPAFEAHRHQRRRRWAELLDGVVGSGAAQGVPVTAASRLQWIAYIGAVNAAVVERTHEADIDVEDIVHTMRTLLRPGILGAP